MNFFLGVDLGTQQDYTAAVMLARTEQLTERRSLPGTWQRHDEKQEIFSTYGVGLIERFPLGIEYGEVITNVQTLLDLPSLWRQSVAVIVDATGVGLPVLQQMRSRGMTPVGVTITGGTSVAENEAGYTVPKRDLVTVMQVLMQSRRIKFSPKLKMAATLKEELQSFRKDVTANRNQTFEARSGEHDDIVLACAIAAWYAERAYGYVTAAPTPHVKDTYDPLKKITM